MSILGQELAKYHKLPKHGEVKNYNEKQEGEVDLLSDNLCASSCANTEGCNSFDYCVGTKLEKGQDDPENKIYGCYLHVPEKDEKTEEWKWNPATTHCDHYSGRPLNLFDDLNRHLDNLLTKEIFHTEKHTHEFVEYTAVKLKDTEFIGEYNDVSVDNWYGSVF